MRSEESGVVLGADSGSTDGRQLLLSDVDHAEDDMQPFMEWLTESVLLSSKTETKKQHAMQYVGSVVGVIATAVAMILSYKFGQRFAIYLSAEASASIVASGLYFGAVSFIPMAVLTSKSSAKMFQNFVTAEDQREKAIMEKKSLCYRFLSKSYFRFFAFAAGIADMTNTFEQFHDLIGGWSWILMIDDFIASSIMNGMAFREINEKVVHSIENNLLASKRKNNSGSENVDLLRYDLRVKLNEGLQIIESMTSEEHDQLRATLYSSGSSLAADEKLRLIFFPKRLVGYTARENISERTKSRGPFFAGLFGAAMGALSSYVYYPLGGEASDYGWNLFGVENSDFLFFSRILFSMAAFAAMGSIGTLANRDRYKKTYTALSKLLVSLIEWLKKHCIARLKKVSCCSRVAANRMAGELSESLVVVADPTETPIVSSSTPSSRKQYCRNFLTVISLIVAITSVSTRVENVILHSSDADAWYTKLFVISAVFGTLVTRFWAMENRLFDPMFTREDPNSRMKEDVSRLAKSVSYFSPKTVRALHAFVKEAETTPASIQAVVAR